MYMKVLIHRGNKEIGASCIEIQSNLGVRILIDVGSELDGARAVLPKAINKIDAIFISHAHPDHFGLLGEVPQKIPCYCGAITECVLETMIAFNYKFKKVDRKFTHLKDGQKILIKDISITPFITDHSVPDSYAFLIESCGKTLLYSGDFRTTGRKPNSAARITRSIKNLDALIIEGTCIDGRASAIKTEIEVQNEVSKVLQNSSVATFLITSAINIDRIVSVFKAARTNKKIFVCDIYTALILWQMGKHGARVPQMTWEHLKVLSRNDISKSQRIALEKHLEELDAREFREKVYNKDSSLTLENIAKEPSKYVIKHSQIETIMSVCKIENANVIYSMWSGYMSPSFDLQGRYETLQKNEKISFKQIHTSGHATKESLFDFIEKLSPKILIPFHTNSPEKFLEKYPNVLMDSSKFTI